MTWENFACTLFGRNEAMLPWETKMEKLYSAWIDGRICPEKYIFCAHVWITFLQSLIMRATNGPVERINREISIIESGIYTKERKWLQWLPTTVERLLTIIKIHCTNVEQVVNIFKSEEKKIAQPRTIQSCSSYFFFRSNSKKINPRES